MASRGLVAIDAGDPRTERRRRQAVAALRRRPGRAPACRSGADERARETRCWAGASGRRGAGSRAAILGAGDTRAAHGRAGRPAGHRRRHHRRRRGPRRGDARAAHGAGGAARSRLGHQLALEPADARRPPLPGDRRPHAWCSRPTGSAGSCSGSRRTWSGHCRSSSRCTAATGSRSGAWPRGMWLYDAPRAVPQCEDAPHAGQARAARGRADAARARAPGRRALLRRAVRRRPADARHRPLGDAPRRAGGELYRGPRRWSGPPAGWSGAQIEDRLTGARGIIRASVVVNATGPWADRVRHAGGLGRGAAAPAHQGHPHRGGPEPARSPRRRSSSPARSTAGCCSSCPGATSPTSAPPTPTPRRAPDQLTVSAGRHGLPPPLRQRPLSQRPARRRGRAGRLGRPPPAPGRPRPAGGERAARASTRSSRARAAMITRGRREAHHLPGDGGARWWTARSGSSGFAKGGAARATALGPTRSRCPGGETDDFEPVSRARAGAGRRCPRASSTCCGTTAPRRPASTTSAAASAGCLRRLVPPHPADRGRGAARGAARDGADGRGRPGPPHSTSTTSTPSAACPRLTRVAELMARERGWDERRVAAEAERYEAFARR